MPVTHKALAIRILIFGAVILHVCLLAWGAFLQSPTTDEVAHLPSGLSHLEFGQFDLYRVNPPLIRTVAAIPLLLMNVQTDWSSYSTDPHVRSDFRVGRDYFRVNAENYRWQMGVARLACIPFSILGAYVCFRWAKELFGQIAGVIACLLWCISPNVIAHGQLITPDLGATALGVATAYAFWKWLNQPSTQTVTVAGFAMGAALLTKSTWVILFGLWPILWVVNRFFATPTDPKRTFWRESTQLGSILIFAVVILNSGYGFEGSFQTLGDFDFVSNSLGGDTLENSPQESPRNRFHNTSMALIPVPLPANYLYGIDFQKRIFEEGVDSYLHGRWKQGGWWYYYLYGMAVKTPLGIWLLLIMALALSLVTSRQKSRFFVGHGLVVLPPILVLAIVSSHTGMNNHMRYILPVLPFMFIWISRIGPLALRNRIIGVATVVCLCWTTASTVWIYPHSLSYFNELVGGPLNGHTHLIDSNIDWGQDVYYLQRWLGNHSEVEDLHLAYFGMYDPSATGMSFSLPSNDFQLSSDQTHNHPVFEPGWYAISVNLLRGLVYRAPDGSGGFQRIPRGMFDYFLRLTPVGYAGYSIYIYHISPDTTNFARCGRGDNWTTNFEYVTLTLEGQPEAGDSARHSNRDEIVN